MKTSRSKQLFAQAQQLLPGGVNSPVRAYKGVGGSPLFIAKAKGSQIFDEDGNVFTDYVLSWGPMILGHAHPIVVKALKSAVERGTSYGAPTKLEVDLAKLITTAFPTIEMVRMVNSGTEATMSAIRIARGFTGRDKIIKFAGCYHGHADGLLVKAGSGATTLGIPDSPGVPADVARHTITVAYNDFAAVETVFGQQGREIAAIIVEPIAANMGVVLPEDGFLQGLRSLTAEHDSLLIFDEVLTGFRVAYGGAQALYGIRPDLTCLGKIIGGGLPVGAYGGRREIMSKVAPSGPVYQAGTLSGNPLAMTAGIETLKLLSKKKVYAQLEKCSDYLFDGIYEAAKRHRIPISAARVGSLMGFFFTSAKVTDYASALTADTKRYAKFFWAMLESGIYFAPSQFEAAFLSTAHSPKDIEQTIRMTDKVFKSL
jgi:glutamate-1-semialdehyde 2,1-aminomutase